MTIFLDFEVRVLGTIYALSRYGDIRAVKKVKPGEAKAGGSRGQESPSMGTLPSLPETVPGMPHSKHPNTYYGKPVNQDLSVRSYFR